MVRKTSIEVYHKVKASGLLSKLRLEIYEALYQNGPMTMHEAFRVLYPDESKGHKLQSTNPRFAELRTMGLIEECGERPCRITGNNVILIVRVRNYLKDYQKKRK